MKTPDLSKTPIVRKFGPRGARWYGRVLFVWLYALLIWFTARLWMHRQDFTAADAWRRDALGWIVAALVVLAASILTQMRIKFFAGVEQLESGQKAGAA